MLLEDLFAYEFQCAGLIWVIYWLLCASNSFEDFSYTYCFSVHNQWKGIDCEAIKANKKASLPISVGDKLRHRGP